MAALLHTFSAPGVPISVAEARMSMGPAKKTHIKSILAIQRVRERRSRLRKENLIGAGGLLCRPQRRRLRGRPAVNRSFFWRSVTLVLMIAGYAGYYLCRSNFSVAVPMLIQEMGARGIPANVATVQLGAIASWGVLAYALGKFPSGWLADFLGGRRNFLYGMGGSILMHNPIRAGRRDADLLLWHGSATGWCSRWVGRGMVKISSRWFSNPAYGTSRWG